MENTQYVINWIGRMAIKHGGTVLCKDGEKLDWGQALCRARYGKEWNKQMSDEGIELPDNEAIIIASRWEKGNIPDFVNLITHK